MKHIYQLVCEIVYIYSCILCLLNTCRWMLCQLYSNIRITSSGERDRDRQTQIQRDRYRSRQTYTQRDRDRHTQRQRQR